MHVKLSNYGARLRPLQVQYNLQMVYTEYCLACLKTAHVTGVDTDSMLDSYSHPLANQGTVTATLRLVRDESCDGEEWTGGGKQDSIKSQGQETQLGVLGTPRRGINTC